TGQLVAARDFGGPSSGGSNASAAGVATDSAGNVYIDGKFDGTGVNFGASLGGSNQPLDSAGLGDAFLVKLDPSLNLSYARRFGSSGTDVASDLAIDANNNLYLAGFVQDTSTYGTTGAGTMILSNVNPAGAGVFNYVLELNSNGDPLQVVG